MKTAKTVTVALIQAGQEKSYQQVTIDEARRLLATTVFRGRYSVPEWAYYREDGTIDFAARDADLAAIAAN